MISFLAESVFGDALGSGTCQYLFEGCGWNCLLSVFTSDFCICVCRCQYCGFNLSVCSRSRHWIILSDLLIYHTLWMTIRCTPMINHWQDRMNHNIVFPDESSGRIFSTGRTSFTWFVLKYIFVCLMWMQTAWWCRSTKESGQSVLPGFAQSVYSVQGNDHNLLLCWIVCVHPVCLILGTHTIGKGF
jgi:hypothetical protein